MFALGFKSSFTQSLSVEKRYNFLTSSADLAKTPQARQAVR
jgi:hypothetical protein